ERLQRDGGIPSRLEEQVREDFPRRPLPGRVRTIEMRFHALKLAGQVRPRRVGLGLELTCDLACHRAPPSHGRPAVYRVRSPASPRRFRSSRRACPDIQSPTFVKPRGTLGRMTMLSWLLVPLALALALWPLGHPSAQSRVETVVSGLEVPWALAFAPDGTLYVTERPGLIRVVKNGRLDPKAVATLTVAARGESGLMGLALDPEFAKNGHLYTCYTMERRGSGALINRVVRFAVRGGLATDEHVLIDEMPGNVFHDGCRLKFGPDGKLYVTMGDAGQDRLAQQRDPLAGKILRINADGSVPGDNPFQGSPVWTLGHRNPQGLAWDSRGRLLESEHGPSGFPGGHDEINLIQPGKNYGWPEVYGKSGDGRFV